MKALKMAKGSKNFDACVLGGGCWTECLDAAYGAEKGWGFNSPSAKTVTGGWGSFLCCALQIGWIVLKLFVFSEVITVLSPPPPVSLVLNNAGCGQSFWQSGVPQWSYRNYRPHASLFGHFPFPCMQSSTNLHAFHTWLDTSDTTVFLWDLHEGRAAALT